jgi:hypothetical protein
MNFISSLNSWNSIHGLPVHHNGFKSTSFIKLMKTYQSSFIKLDNEDIKFELETFQFAMNMFKDYFKR